MKTYQIVSGKYGVVVMIKDHIKPQIVERLANEHYEELLRTRGKFGIFHEAFITFFNKKLGENSATYAPYKTNYQHLILL